MLVPILYQDDDIVVIDKPAGMPTHAVEANDPYPADALRITQAQLGLPYLGMHQRLDAETSGVLLFAARREANPALAAAFAGREVQKIYLALVHGVPGKPAGTIDLPIARETGERYRVTTPRDKRGQQAITHYKVLESSLDRRYSLLEVNPETGRSHQIRVHLAQAGSPVVGDPLYGAPPAGGPAGKAKGSGPAGEAARGSRQAGREQRRGALPAAGPGARRGPPAAGYEARRSATPAQIALAQPPPPAPRLALHAYRLTLPHPATGESVTFNAPPPLLFTRVAAGLPELALAAGQRHIRRIKDGTPGLAQLIHLAIARRAPLADDTGTNIYRLINAGSDGLPGLTVDRYGPALVAGVYDETGRPEAIDPLLFERLVEATGAEAIYVKYRQRQASQVEEEELPALAPARPVIGSGPAEYVAYEDGLAYLVRPGEGWNPGLFADMREMRGRVRAWAAGQRVLNTFAYTCGFGLAAVAGGATRVVNLDVSRPTLERGRDNYRANGFPSDEHDFLYGDAFDWLGRLARRQDLFDMVILDPPGFARTKQSTFSAAHDYGKLAQAAAGVTAPGGLLIACCNVAELSWRSFRDRVIAGLDEAWRAAEVVGVYHAPALDFPPAGGRESYLKILAARLA